MMQEQIMPSPQRLPPQQGRIIAPVFPHSLGFLTQRSLARRLRLTERCFRSWVPYARGDACKTYSQIGTIKGRKYMKRNLLASMIGFALLTGSTAFAAGVTVVMIEADAKTGKDVLSWGMGQQGQ
eukprot:gene57370-76595_t